MSATETFQKLATRLMSKYGVSAVRTRVVLSHDEENDVVSEVTITAKIKVVLNVKEIDDGNGKLTTETYIKSDSQLAPEDRIKVANQTYIVESVEELAPQATGIFYKGRVRG